MRTVAVIEGFSGGPLHTRHFRKALDQAGFKVIRNRRKADIVIAHSAGIYGYPVNSRAKLVLLIAPTYWPGEPLIKRVLRHTKTSRQHHVAAYGWRFYIWKKILEVYYIFRRNSYMWLGIFNNNRLNHLISIAKHPGRKTIIVRNHADPFSSPDLKNVLKHENIDYLYIPGVHDDFLMNPKPYIEIIKNNL